MLSSATLFVKYNKSDRKNWWKVNSIDQGLNEIDRYVEFFVNISEFTDRRTSGQCTCACSWQQNWQGWCCKWRWNSSLVRTARTNYRKGEFVVLFINDVMPTMFSGKCPPDNFYKNRYAIPHGFWSKTKPKYPSQQITKVFIFLHIFLVVN